MNLKTFHDKAYMAQNTLLGATIVVIATLVATAIVEALITRHKKRMAERSNQSSSV